MTIRWGFLGAGYVASRAMASAVHGADGAVLQAVASREESRSRALEPVDVFENYESLIASPNIDAVYISLTNSQHRHWVVEALHAGKHVLCEKPLGIGAEDVELMHQAAHRSGMSLVEAVWVRWHPRHRRFTEIVRSGDLGETVHVWSAFTFTSDMSDNYRLRPEFGGGALLDVGCYQVHTWIAAFGSKLDVRVIEADRVIGPTGVDLTTRSRVEIRTDTSADTSLADMVCSFIEEPQQVLTARGSQGEVAMHRGEAFTSWREPSSLLIGNTEEQFPEVDAFQLMVEQVSRQFAGLEPPLFDPDDSLRVAQIIDRIAGSSHG